MGRTDLIALSNLAKLVPTDKADARDALADAGISPQVVRGVHLYPLYRGATVLMERKEGLGKKASELNQEAQAKLNDVRRKALERELIPIAEAETIVAKFATMTSDTIERSALTMDEQNQLFEALKDAAKALDEGGGN